MKNTNIELAVLKAIGIIVVVSCHLERNIFNLIGIPISDTTELFAEYSYHMPLFVFTSGYFYKTIYESNVLKLAKRRFSSIKKYLKCNMFYFILTFILVKMGLFHREVSFSLRSLLIEPFLGGFQFYFNGPGWFVPFLFLLQIFYTYIRKLIWSRVNCSKEEKNTLKEEFSFLILLIIVGTIAVRLSNIYPVIDDKVNVLQSFLRILFGLQFFQIGYMYKEFISGKIKYTFQGFLLVLISKITIFYIFGYYTFSLRTIEFNNHIILPLVVSLLGILYSLHLANFIVQIYDRSKSKLIDFICSIGNHTWSIMMHHLLVKWTLDKIYGLSFFPDNMVEIGDYYISPILCVLLPLGFAYIYDNKIRKIDIIGKLKLLYFKDDEKFKKIS